MLEQSLLNSSKSLQQASSLTDMSSEHQEDSLNVSTTLDEDISVDILSTDAFQQTSENEVGYFGASQIFYPRHQYILMKLLRRAEFKLCHVSPVVESFCRYDNAVHAYQQSRFIIRIVL